MGIRTTADEVKAEMSAGENDYDGRTVLDPFIAQASSLVDTVVTVGARMGRLKLTLSTAQQRQLETVLAAAMYCFSDRQMRTSNSGKSNATFLGADGSFLEATSYGRKACMMDVTRVLKPLVEGRIAGFVWLGRVPSDQTPYSERN